MNDALDAWLRGRLVDEWLEEHQAEHGASTGVGLAPDLVDRILVARRFR